MMTGMENCVFCGIVSGHVPGTKVAEDDLTLTFMDINPAADGHMLVIPKFHSEDLLEIDAEDLTAVTLSAQRVAKAAMSELGADGVNLLNCCKAPAWQTVFHFHLHVVPRHGDDGIALSWPRKDPARDTLEGYAARLRQALAATA